MNWQEILGWGEGEINDLRYVAYSYIKQGVYDVALTVFEAIAVLTPPTAYDLQTVGALHLQMGNGQKALDYLEKALKLNPNDIHTQMNRAKVLFSLGYKRQGLMQASALQHAQDPEIVKQASALLLAYSSTP